MREKGISTFYASPSRRAPTCGRVVMPDAIREYGAFMKLQGYLMLQPRPKNRPSPGISSWSGRRPVWLLPMFAP